MPKLEILDHTGHTTMEFDPTTKQGVSEAMEAFDKLVKGQGYTAAAKIGDGQHKVIREFDPNADTLIIPRLKGG